MARIPVRPPFRSTMPPVVVCALLPVLALAAPADTDKDGSPDFAETTEFGTDPLLPDTDGGGLFDVVESALIPLFDPNNDYLRG